MIEVKFFASLREQLQSEGEQLTWHSHFATVNDLIQHLCQCHEKWHMALNNPTILVAVNQQLSSSDSSLKDGDEVAFFPPVTGG